MKKLFSLLTALLFVGTMWGAENDVAYTLDFTAKTANNNTYGNTWTYGDFSIFAGSNNNYQNSWLWVRFGGKGGDNTEDVSTINSTITATKAITDKVIKRVTVNNSTVSSGNYTANKCTLQVASNSTFTDIIDTRIIDSPVETATSFNFTPNEVTVWPASSYYKITIGATIKGKSNVGVDITTIQFIEGPSQTEPSVSLSPEDLTLNPTDVATQVITVTCNNFTNAISEITTGLYSNAGCTTPVTSGAWITNINDNNANQVTFSVADNAGEQRQIWLKVTATDGTSTESAVLPITQKRGPLTTVQEIYETATTIGSTPQEVAITFDGWVVSGVSDYNAYVTDGTKGFVFNYNNHGFAVGEILTGTAYVNLRISAKRATITGINSGTITKATGGVVTPVVVSITDLGGINTGAPIIVNNVTYNGTNLIDVNSNTIRPYNELYPEMSFTNGKAYNVTGIYVEKNTTKDIYPRSAADIVEVPAASVNPVALDFGEVGIDDDAPAAKTITVTGTNLTSALTIAALTNYDYAVTDGSLTPSEGGVSATVTITPKSGFTASAGEKNETLTISGGGLANNVTVNITAIVKNKYTITWNNNGNTSVTSTVLDGEKPAFPETPSACDATSTTFVGWATAAWSGKIASIADKTVYTTADAMPAVTDDITYYAVFVKESEGGLTTKWVLTNLNAVTEGVYALLTTNNKAFNGTITSGHGQATDDAFSFTNSEAASAPEGTCELTFTAVTGGFTMYNEDLGYLYAKAASSGNLEWQETEESYWCYVSDNWCYSKNSARLRSYNGSTFRTYSTNNGDVLALAKKTTAPAKEYSDYMTTCPNDPTALEDVETSVKAVKVLKNGLLLIEKNGKTYNAQGQLIK